MENKAKYVDLVLFDLDGTLVDSRKDIANAVNFTLREIGLKEKGLQEISSYIGRGVRDLLLKSLGANQKELLEKALSIFTEYFRKHSTDESFLYPGVAEVLGYFGKKRKIIVTNRNHEFAVLTLKALDIYDYFENILGGDDGGCVKPSSCPLDKTIHSLNVDKDKSIMIGDMDIDILAGKGAGIATCAVTYGIGRREEILKAKPDYIIDDILELKKIIR